MWWRPAARPAPSLHAVLLVALLGGRAPGSAHAAATATWGLTAAAARFENVSRLSKGTVWTRAPLATTSPTTPFAPQTSRTGAVLPSKSAWPVTQSGAAPPAKSTPFSLQSPQAGAASVSRVTLSVPKVGATGSSTPPPVATQAGVVPSVRSTSSSQQVTQAGAALQSKPPQTPAQAIAAMTGKATPGLQGTTQAAGAAKSTTPTSVETTQAAAGAPLPTKSSSGSAEAASAGAVVSAKSTSLGVETTQAGAGAPARPTPISGETTQAGSALLTRSSTSSESTYETSPATPSTPPSPSTSEQGTSTPASPLQVSQAAVAVATAAAPLTKSTTPPMDSTEAGAAEEGGALATPSSPVTANASAGAPLGMVPTVPVRGRILGDPEDVGGGAAAEEPAVSTAAAPKVASRAMISEWEEFKRKNNKTYHSRDELRRMARMYRGHNTTLDMHSEEDRMSMFMARKAAIDDFNRNTRVTFRRAINQFADLTPQEVVKKHTGLLLSKRKPRGSEYDYVRVTGRHIQHMPTSFDWRDRGALTEPRNQATCGCCWAFAATAVMEAKNFIRSKTLVALSEQNLLDCDTINEKCDGGTPWDAFDWIQSNGGQEENEKYPYEVMPDKCRQDPSRIVRLQVRGYMIVRPAVEENVMGALLAEGPLTIAVNANPVTFQDYKEGVYSDPECTSAEDDLRHAVVLVGYGEDPQGGPYWTVRNSWGRDWGEGGYVRISRANNLCGVMTYAVFPSLE